MPQLGTGTLGSSQLGGPHVQTISFNADSTSSFFSEIDGGEVSSPNKIGSARLGSSKIGITGTVRTVNLDSNSDSTLTHNVRTIIPLELKPETTGLGKSQLGDGVIGDESEGFGAYSNLTHEVNGTFTLSKTSSSEATISNDLSRLFTLSIKSTRNRIGESTLGSSQIGVQSDGKFDSYSQLKQNTSAVFSLQKISASTSTVSFTPQAIRFINLNADSISDFEFILSEDSYAEQYGRERGNAEIDTVVEGTAELDIIVVGNAEVD